MNSIPLSLTIIPGLAHSGGHDATGLIEQEDGMRTWRDVEGDFLKLSAHCFAVAKGQNDAGGLALGATDCAEQPCI